MFDVRLFGYTCPYSCRSCWFNQANPSRVKVSLSEAATAKLSHDTGTTQPLCSRRGVELFSPSGMICEIYALQPEEVEESALFCDLGPVYTLVGDLGSGDRAVPLEDGSKLQRGDTTGCTVCGLRSYGLNILEKNGSRFDFCSTAHYLEWWKARNSGRYNFFSKHDTPSLETEGQPRVILLEQEPAHEVIKRNASVRQTLGNLLLRLAYAVRRVLRHD